MAILRAESHWRQHSHGHVWPNPAGVQVCPRELTPLQHQASAFLYTNMNWLSCADGRLPYVPMNKQQRVEGCRLLERVAEHIPGVKDIRPLEDDDFLLLRKY